MQEMRKREDLEEELEERRNKCQRRGSRKRMSRQGMKHGMRNRSGSASAADTGRNSMLKQSSLLHVAEGSEMRGASRRPAPPPMLKPYLSDEADVFEVDEKRGAPLPRDVTLNDGGGQRAGFGGWLSDLLERTIFW
ncbi:hypothetical protein ACTXT7_009743 [Hymenolepis weldensis]